MIQRGRSSVVERQLPKLYVEGSIPFARSIAAVALPMRMGQVCATPRRGRVRTFSQSDYDALARKTARLLGREQLAALAPSQRTLLFLQLNELLEARGGLVAVSPEDVCALFARIAGVAPVINDPGSIREDF